MKKIQLIFLLIPCLSVGCKDLFEKDISRRQVSVIAPVDGAQTTPGGITFLWQALADAETYQLTLVTPSFEAASRVVADTLVAGLKFTIDLAEGMYQWSLTPRNFAYTGVRSVYSLSIAEPPQDPEPEPTPEPEPEPTPTPEPEPGSETETPATDEPDLSGSGQNPTTIAAPGQTGPAHAPQSPAHTAVLSFPQP